MQKNTTPTRTKSTDRAAAAEALVKAHLANRAARLIVRRFVNGHVLWLVKGTAPAPYVVSLQPLVTCDCPDFARNHAECKHVKAARLLAEAEALAATTPAPVAPAAPTRTRRPYREEIDLW